MVKSDTKTETQAEQLCICGLTFKRCTCWARSAREVSKFARVAGWIKLQARHAADHVEPPGGKGGWSWHGK